ncbi:MAG: SAF domain-containing protein [Myxococcota bacterium]
MIARGWMAGWLGFALIGCPHGSSTGAGPSAVGAVATRDLGSAEVIGADDVEPGPAPTVGDGGSIVPVEAALGRSVCDRILAGEVVRAERLGEAGCGGARVVRAPVPPWSTTAITVGAWVDLFDGTGEDRGVLLSGRVVDVEPDALVVTVRGDDADADAPSAPAIAAQRGWDDVTGCAEPTEPPPAVPVSFGKTGPTVAVAVRPLTPGVPIDGADVAALPAPKGPGLPIGDVVGRVPFDRIYPGEVVRPERLATPGDDAPVGIHAMIPCGLFAVAVPVDGSPAVQAGQIVDLAGDGLSLDGLLAVAVEPGAVVVLAAASQLVPLADALGGATGPVEVRPSAGLR